MRKNKKFSFACNDIGMNCNFTATSSDKNELMKQIAEHAKNAHNIQQIDAELQKKIDAAIKTT
ncbi:MAG: DUF1059 domain-containing protein [Candidatus Micrarchaeaceae archaeon]